MTQSSPPDDSVTVLVADDDPDLAETYALWLQREYTVRTAAGGRDALDAYDDDVDVVVLDRRMPALPGDEVLARLRERGATCRVSMITAVEPDPDIVDLPVDDYLVKPVGREALVETVEHLATLNAYDEPSRELFALSAKLGALAATNPVDEAARNTVEELREEVERRRDELHASGDLAPDDWLFRTVNDHANGSLT